MKNHRTKPIIGIITDRQQIGAHWQLTAMEKYVKAVSGPVEGTPLLIPVMEQTDDVANLIGTLDGLLLTGGYSNIEARHYGEEDLESTELHDPARDATSLAIIRAVLEHKIPLLGICRGFQELNVALGGSLYQAVHTVDGLDDHREDTNKALEEQYGLAHPVYLIRNGLLHRLMGSTSQMVNSLHGQGIKRLADGLQIEAMARDGLIEAVSVKGSTHFALAVQWHPEWNYKDQEFYLQLFNAFGAACRRQLSVPVTFSDYFGSNR